MRRELEDLVGAEQPRCLKMVRELEGLVSRTAEVPRDDERVGRFGLALVTSTVCIVGFPRLLKLLTNLPTYLLTYLLTSTVCIVGRILPSAFLEKHWK